MIMKRIITLFSFSLFALMLAMDSPVQAQFTPGNVVVLTVGNGTTTLASVATPLVLKEYNKTTVGQTSPVSTINIPYNSTMGAARLTSSGSATSEGQMTLSSDSTRLVIPGYDADSGTASITGTVSTATARAIDTVSYRGIVGRADTTQIAFSGNNIRTATRNGSENYWAAGANTGVYYMGNLSTPTAVYATATNMRVLNPSNGKLYFSTGSGLSRIGRINSQPISGTVTADTMIICGTGTTPSPYGFAVNSAENVVYIADDRTAAPGGIQKWTLSGTTWTNVYTFSMGTSTGARSLVVDWSGTYPTIYAVTNNTTGGSLVKVTDSNATAPVLVLANGTATTAFRSLAFVPINPCASFSAAITASSPLVRCQGDTVTLNATTGTGYKYVWMRGVSVLSNDTLQTLKAIAGGTYTVTIHSINGCTATSSGTLVAINPRPITTVSASGPTTFCTGGSIQLCVPAVSGLTYQWKKNGSVVTNAYSCDTINASGSYKVIVTNTSTGCLDSSVTTTVTVGPPPPSMLSPNGLVNLCIGSTMKLHANSSNGLTYTWKKNDTLISGSVDSTLTISTNGTYKVFVSAGPGCMDSGVASVGFTALPNTQITKFNKDTVCAGDTIRVRGFSESGDLYEWIVLGVGSSGATTDSNYFQVTPASVTGPTQFFYKLIVTNRSGCVDSSAVQTVTVIPPPSPVITRPGFNLDAGPGLTYQWFLNGTPIPGATGRTLTPVANGIYSVRVGNGYCYVLASGYTVTGLRVENTLENAGIMIYPNPVKDLLKVNAGFKLNLVIKDLSGREVLRANSVNEISLGALSNGVYTISVYKLDGTLLGSRLITHSGN